MFKIPHFVNKYQDLEDNGLLWGLIKMEIRASHELVIQNKKLKSKEYLIQEASRL